MAKFNPKPAVQRIPSPYRAFDLKAKELGYWRVSICNQYGQLGTGIYLTQSPTAAAQLQFDLAQQYTPEDGYYIELESPTDWEARS